MSTWENKFTYLSLVFLLLFCTVTPVFASSQDVTVISNSAYSSTHTGGINGADGEDGQDGTPGQSGASGRSGTSVTNYVAGDEQVSTIIVESSAGGETLVEVNNEIVSDRATSVTPSTTVVAELTTEAGVAADPSNQNRLLALLTSLQLLLTHYVNSLF